MVTTAWLLAFFSPGYSEMLLLMLVALLLYGGDLPKVARSWGKTLAEFRKGLSGLQNEFHDVMRDTPRRIPYTDPIYSEQTPEEQCLNDQGYNDEDFATRTADSASSVVEGEATISEVAAEETQEESRIVPDSAAPADADRPDKDAANS